MSRGFRMRLYRTTDEASVLKLLRVCLGGGPEGDRSARYFRWKHLENPFGRSLLLVAETDAGIVGLRAFMRWRLQQGDRTYSAVRAVDTATHPAFQGRGIFRSLTMEALARLHGEADLVFNTPNEKSLPGYLKMGWSLVGEFPVDVSIRRPVSFARRAVSLRKSIDREPAGERPQISARSAREVLGDDEEVTLLLKRSGDAGGIATVRDSDYLRWRYASAPLDYRAVVDRGESGLNGVAIFRARPRGALLEATIAELITVPEDASSLRRLLRQVARSAPVDHITCVAPKSLSSRLRAGLMRAPGGIAFVVNPLCKELEPIVTQSGSWTLSLGDLEVF